MANFLRVVLAFAMTSTWFTVYAVNRFESRPAPELSQYITKGDYSSFSKHKGQLKIGLEKPLYVDFLFYRSKVFPEIKEKPLVIIFSNIAGITLLEKWFARYFAANGVHVALSHCLEHESVTRIEETNESAVRTILAGFALTDFGANISDVDAKKIGLLGISFGGIRGLYQMGFDPRIKAGAFIVSGGPIQEIMAYSRQVLAKQIRGRLMRDAQIGSIDEYLNFLDAHIELDLNTALSGRSSEDFYLFISGSDNWVPSHYQWKIWSQLGKPRFERYALGHLATPFWVAMTRKKEILGFFQDRWK